MLKKYTFEIYIDEDEGLIGVSSNFPTVGYELIKQDDGQFLLKGFVPMGEHTRGELVKKPDYFIPFQRADENTVESCAKGAGERVVANMIATHGYIKEHNIKLRAEGVSN